MTIQLRLLLLTATGLLAALLMGLVSYLNNGRTAEVISANQTILTALRNWMPT